MYTYKEELEGVPFALSDIPIPCKRLHQDAKLPVKSGKLEAGYDICCVVDGDFWSVVDFNGMPDYSPESRLMSPERMKETYNYDVELGDAVCFMYPKASKKFHTGIAVAIPEGRCWKLWDRSGMGANKNIHRLAGIIDCTWRGEILVSLINLSSKIQIIKAGDKIIQAITSLVIPGDPFWVDELDDTYRGNRGFGELGGQ